MSERVITRSEFAKLVDLSKGRVTQLVDSGMPTTADGKLDVAEAQAWIRANVRQRAPARRVEPQRSIEASETISGPDNYAEARYRLTLAQTQKALADAERSEVALAAERRETIPRDLVRRCIREWNIKTRIGFLNLPTRRGPELAAKLGVDRATMVSELEVIMREHLIEMADEPMPFVPDAPLGERPA